MFFVALSAGGDAVYGPFYGPFPTQEQAEEWIAKQPVKSDGLYRYCVRKLFL